MHESSCGGLCFAGWPLRKTSHDSTFLTSFFTFHPYRYILSQAAILGDHAKDAKGYGWSNLDAGTHDWATLRSNVQDYIKGLNFSYRVQLREAGVTYLNKLGAIFVVNCCCLLLFSICQSAIALMLLVPLLLAENILCNNICVLILFQVLSRAPIVWS